MNIYSDIISLSRPPSLRRRMPLSDRAKIFAPFAALKGFDEMVREKEKVLVQRKTLTDYSQEQLDKKLHAIKRGDVITVTFFQSEKYFENMDLGMYINVEDTVRRVDAVHQALVLSKTTIRFADILDIHCPSCSMIFNDFLE